MLLSPRARKCAEWCRLRSVKMPVFKVNVKWGKEKFQDVECNTDEPPMVFKAQVFALSGVQPERQKVMIKGAVIKDDEWGSTASKLKNGVTLLMMGSADELPAEPAQKVVFMEDMTDTELASALQLPAGLTNLGNTCYMNATVQCLRSVPELKEALRMFQGGVAMGGAMTDQSITAAMRDLFESMDKTSEAIPPIVMLNVLHMCFPQFAEKNEHGTFQQQDANECWTELVRCLQKKVPPLVSGNEQADATAVATPSKLFMEQYFGGEFEITMKCVESEEEGATHSAETFYQLSCFIEKVMFWLVSEASTKKGEHEQSASVSEVKYLHTGLKNRLEEHITKHSPTLSRDAQYLKSCKIKRLPAYLTIQMVRFYYKEKEAVNAKILKDIKFPMNLDVFDLCSSELQQKLVPARDRFKEEEDRKAEAMTKEKKSKGKPGTTQAASAAGDTKSKKEPYWFADDPGSNNSGYYELQAVLTHKGRSSSSGHYVGWVRKTGDDWLMFDDDKVSAVAAEDILRLSGGGDWHCAYVLLYGPRILELEEGGAKSEAAEEAKETPMDTETTQP